MCLATWNFNAVVVVLCWIPSLPPQSLHSHLGHSNCPLGSDTPAGGQPCGLMHSKGDALEGRVRPEKTWEAPSTASQVCTITSRPPPYHRGRGLQAPLTTDPSWAPAQSGRKFSPIPRVGAVPADVCGGLREEGGETHCFHETKRHQG